MFLQAHHHRHLLPSLLFVNTLLTVFASDTCPLSEGNTSSFPISFIAYMWENRRVLAVAFTLPALMVSWKAWRALKNWQAESKEAERLRLLAEELLQSATDKKENIAPSKKKGSDKKRTKKNATKKLPIKQNPTDDNASSESEREEDGVNIDKLLPPPGIQARRSSVVFAPQVINNRNMNQEEPGELPMKVIETQKVKPTKTLLQPLPIAQNRNEDEKEEGEWSTVPTKTDELLTSLKTKVENLSGQLAKRDAALDEAKGELEKKINELASIKRSLATQQQAREAMETQLRNAHAQHQGAIQQLERLQVVSHDLLLVKAERDAVGKELLQSRLLVNQAEDRIKAVEQSRADLEAALTKERATSAATMEGLRSQLAEDQRQLAKFFTNKTNDNNTALIESLERDRDEWQAKAKQHLAALLEVRKQLKTQDEAKSPDSKENIFAHS